MNKKENVITTKIKTSDVILQDITLPDNVSIRISNDRKSIWVDVEGECVFRATRIRELFVADESKPS